MSLGQAGKITLEVEVTNISKHGIWILSGGQELFLSLILGTPYLIRTRYFTDSGIIGTKAFVASHYQRFKHLFQSKRDKIPRRVNGLGGIYSLKRLGDSEQ